MIETNTVPKCIDQIAAIAEETVRCNGIEQLHMTIDGNGLRLLRWREPGSEQFTYASNHSLDELQRRIRGRGLHARPAHV